ncbi:MAG: tetraacyldisaccharide 4'-kinase [Maribacter sp.]|nr:tetraacyldisaccharide 4'-kinase [Maribacter sp.]
MIILKFYKPLKIKYYIFVLVQRLRKIAFPISLVYAFVVHIRNYLYDKGIFKSRSFSIPILCVGNLSMGGTGKTPMSEFLIATLKDTYKVAFLSRGYKRKSKGFVLASSKSTVEDIGDEPFQIHSKFPSVVVAVDADRTRGILTLQNEANPDVIVLDDAFQHRKVTAGFSVLLTAFGNLYCDDRYFPTGNLRDSRREAKRADIIIVTKSPPHLTQNEQGEILKRIQPTADQKVLFSYLVYGSFLEGENEKMALSSIKNRKVTLITGIADPTPLVSFLNETGIAFEHLNFRDHHFFRPHEIRLFNSKECVLTTEKDYTRLKGHVRNLYYLPIKHGFLNHGEHELKDALHHFMKRYS